MRQELIDTLRMLRGIENKLKTMLDQQKSVTVCARCGDASHRASTYHHACDVCGSKEHATGQHEVIATT